MPGLSAPSGHGRALLVNKPSGQAVLTCAAAFAGRPASARSLRARAPGRLPEASARFSARFWADRWRRCLPAPADAALRADRLGRDLDRWRALQADSTHIKTQLGALLAATPGQILTRS